MRKLSLRNSIRYALGIGPFKAMLVQSIETPYGAMLIQKHYFTPDAVVYYNLS